MSKKMTFEGGKELERLLKELGQKEATKIGNRVMRAATKRMFQEIRDRAPVGTQSTRRTRRKKNGQQVVADYGRLTSPGNLKFRKLPKKPGSTEISFMVITGDAFWGYFLEYGTVDMPAQPFIRPTFDREATPTLEFIGDELNKGIVKSARKFGKILPNGRNA